MIGIKIVCGSETRRFKYDAGEYPALLAKVRSSFTLPMDAPLVLKYRDDEDDLCTISTSEELQEAHRLAHPHCLRVQLETDDFEFIAQQAAEDHGGDLLSTIRAFRRADLAPVRPVVKCGVVVSARDVRAARRAAPESTDLLRSITAFGKSRLRPTTTVTRSISDVVGTDVVFSERQNRMIRLKEPKRVKSRSFRTNHSGPKRGTLRDAMLREIASHQARAEETGAPPVHHLRPFRRPGASRAALRHSPRRAHALLRGIASFPKADLRKAHTVTRSISDVLGTNRIFSERQGRPITLKEPRRAHQSSRPRGGCPGRPGGSGGRGDLLADIRAAAPVVPVVPDVPDVPVTKPRRPVGRHDAGPPPPPPPSSSSAAETLLAECDGDFRKAIFQLMQLSIFA